MEAAEPAEFLTKTDPNRNRETDENDENDKPRSKRGRSRRAGLAPSLFRKPYAAARRWVWGRQRTATGPRWRHRV